MTMSMRREFPRSPESLPVKNIIFLNTDVTSSFLMLKTSSKNKNTFSRVSSIQNQHNYFFAELAKNIM